MRIHVLGLGSVGSLVSFHLRKSLSPAHSITLFHKNARFALRLQQQGGLRLEFDGVPSTASGFKADVFNLPERPSHFRAMAQKAVIQDVLFEKSNSNQLHPTSSTSSENEPIESLFVATKTSKTLRAFERVAHRLRPSSTIVLVQNGMGIYEELIDTFFPRPASRPHFIMVSNTHAVHVKKPYNIVQRQVGQLTFALVPDIRKRNYEFGLFDQSIPVYERRPSITDITIPQDEHFQHYKSLRNTVAALLLVEPLNPKWVSMADLQLELRSNLVVDTVINSLSGLMNCRVGDIFTTSASLGVMRRICAEASRAFQHEFRDQSLAQAQEELEIETNPTVDPFPEELSVQALERACLREVEQRATHIAPLLADIRRGKPTDAQYFNGYLIKLGRTYGTELPATLVLLQLLQMRSAIPLDQIF